MQVVEEPTRQDVLLDLILTNKEGLVEDVRVGVSLGRSDHEIVEFRMLRGRSRTMSQVQPWSSRGPTLASSETC